MAAQFSDSAVLGPLANNGGALPFGCHGWPHIAPDFWRPYIAACGYEAKLAA